MNKFYKVLIVAVSTCLSAFAQKSNEVPKGWHLMDKETSGFYGVSADKAYSFIKSRNLKSRTVVVAVIDTGIDTLQEDLKPVLWTNPKEIPNNGIDDDKNGYADDIHGWNFLGGRGGKNVKKDSDEGARVYYGLKSKWDNKTVNKETLTKGQAYEYEMFVKAKAAITGNVDKENDVSDVDVLSLKDLHKDLMRILSKDY